MENKIVEALGQNIKTLMDKYAKSISSNNTGESLNILKNIETIIHILDRMSSNDSMNSVLDGLSKVWDQLPDSDSVAKTIAGDDDLCIFQRLMQDFNYFVAVENECAKTNTYYNKKNTEQVSGIYNFNQYKQQLNLFQYKGKTYLNTILERNNKENKIND